MLGTLQQEPLRDFECDQCFLELHTRGALGRQLLDQVLLELEHLEVGREPFLVTGLLGLELLPILGWVALRRGRRFGTRARSR